MRPSLFLLCFLSAGLLADEPKIVISPKGRAPATVPDNLEKDFPGFIIIRPKGQAAVSTAVPMNPSVATQPNPAPAEKKDAKAAFDYWFAAAVDGQLLGYCHWTASESEKDGKKFLLGLKRNQFTFDRFGDTATMFIEESSVETLDGEVLVTSMRQGIGKDQVLAMSGVVDGKTLKVNGEGNAKGASKEIPWPAGVAGVVREPQLFREQGLKANETFEYLSYVGNLNRVQKITVTFEGDETATFWEGSAPRKYRRYLSKTDPIGKVKMPDLRTWVDVETGEPFRLESTILSLGGRVTFLRTTKEGATAPIRNPVKLFNAQSIRLNTEIANVHGRQWVVYKIKAGRDDEPGTMIPPERRQEIKNLDEQTKTFELHVKASHGPVKDAKPEPVPGKEFLGSNYFIKWDDPLVKGHAGKAVAGMPGTAGDWQKARAVETWVKQNMQAIEFSQAMATADNVAKTLSGDCTEYAMLSAAMCRALGIPSRTVLGLIYAPGPGGKPYLAYHMWFEVYAEGQWLPLDATLGQGGIGPSHIKIADHSWHYEKSFAPLLPVLRVLMAKPDFEVMKVSP